MLAEMRRCLIEYVDCQLFVVLNDQRLDTLTLEIHICTFLSQNI